MVCARMSRRGWIEHEFFDFIYMDPIPKLLSTQHIYGYNLYLDASRKWNRQPKICSLLASTNCVLHVQNSNPVIELILYLDAFRILKEHVFSSKRTKLRAESLTDKKRLCISFISTLHLHHLGHYRSQNNTSESHCGARHNRNI